MTMVKSRASGPITSRITMLTHDSGPITARITMLAHDSDPIMWLPGWFMTLVQSCDFIPITARVLRLTRDNIMKQNVTVCSCVLYMGSEHVVIRLHSSMLCSVVCWVLSIFPLTHNNAISYATHFLSFRNYKKALSFTFLHKIYTIGIM